MNDVQKNLMNIVSSIVNEKEIIQINDEDLFCILKFAYQYKIFTVIYNYIILSDKSKKFECFEKSFYNSNVLNANQEFFYNKIIDYSEENHIEILLLKGFQIAGFFPEKSLREMCDIDFYYDIKDRSRVAKMMKSTGFEFKERQLNHDIWHHKGTNVFVESHFSLSGINQNYFKQLISRRTSVNGGKYVYQMSNEDLLIYTVIHINNHLLKGTFNYKHFLDFYILRVRGNVDFNYVILTINSIGLIELYENLDKASQTIFENKNYKEITGFIEYILGNINFGNNAISRYAVEFNGKVRFALRRIFPKKEKIYVKFPGIKKYKSLLPLGYIMRLLGIIFRQRNEIPYQLKIMKSIDKLAVKSGEEQNKFLQEFGVKEGDVNENNYVCK